jgi:hypothetical protein
VREERRVPDLAEGRKFAAEGQAVQEVGLAVAPTVQVHDGSEARLGSRVRLEDPVPAEVRDGHRREPCARCRREGERRHIPDDQLRRAPPKPRRLAGEMLLPLGHEGLVGFQGARQVDVESALLENAHIDPSLRALGATVPAGEQPVRRLAAYPKLHLRLAGA